MLKHLASGGMAEVLLARADGIEGFERHVVLKRIRPEHARDQRFIQMFLDEARLAAGLHHQSIVQVFDIGASNGEYFFAMEYVHGEDLRKLLSAVAKARTYVPLDLVCAIVSAAASALHYAHERRDARGRPLEIVHRDVSPSNILIGYDGAVKVVDFGIARATVRTSETVAGSLKGKISYMSPEQCRCGPIDRRSDVYGLGVLLYELSTTSRLFKGDSDYLVMDAIVNGKFALPQVRRPDLPNELASIIMRALATDPKRRYQTAEELRCELDDFAARNYGIATPAMLAAYMKKIFGVRPEPWLDPSLEPEIARSGGSWNDSAGSDDARRDSRRSTGLLPRPAAAATTAQRPAVIETAPTQKFGWEAANRMQAARASTLRWVAVPLVAVAGLGAWMLAIRGDDPQHESAPATSAAAVAPAPARAVEPSPTAPIATPVAAAPEPTSARPDAPTTDTAPIIAPPRERARDAKPSKKPERDKLDRAAVRTAAAPVPSTPEPEVPRPPPAPVAPAPVATPAPAAPAAVATAAPAPVTPPSEAPAPAAPKELEVKIPVLSNATVNAVAANYAHQLAKCESSAPLRGEVAVSFQIDAAGKVVKSQLSSTIKNPKVAACILKAVQSWKFPRPRGGVARGVYSISYQ